MQVQEEMPCRQCRMGMHRICTHPVAIPTLLTYLRRAKDISSETLSCCDRKEFWTQQLYP
ncbi:MAG TPA: hypothetical protein VGR53_09085 [Nitrososphaerales archaeon]|nr:hypothetical protein [Nitrososphaerales archaeon]